MKVKATKLGYYDHKRRYAGAVFELKSKKEFSDKWMEELDEDEEFTPVEKPSARPKKKAIVESELEA